MSDLHDARVSMEVLNEYRKIVQWLEAQSAILGPVGDTMHGLAAEAMKNLIDKEYSRHKIPVYAMLDVWMALRGTPEGFDDFYAEHGYAETWARLLDSVRKRSAADAVVTVEMIERAIMGRTASKAADAILALLTEEDHGSNT